MNSLQPRRVRERNLPKYRFRLRTPFSFSPLRSGKAPATYGAWTGKFAGKSGRKKLHISIALQAGYWRVSSSTNFPTGPRLPFCARAVEA